MPVNLKELNATLWKSADDLRVNSDPKSSEYSTPIMGLIFLKFAKDLNVEDERHIREGLTVEELELFDLMKKEKLTEAETVALKNAARALLKRLKEEKSKVLVQDWNKDQQSQARVKAAIERALDLTLPPTYDRLAFQQARDKAYGLIFERASQGVAWVN